MKGQETINKKKEKHSKMIIKAIEVKLQYNSLTLLQKEQLNTLFREAKWFKNYCISQPDIFKVDTKIKDISVVKGDKTENEKLTLLSGHMKQDLKAELIASIKMLSTKKKQGHKDKVGKLKFKSECNEIPLRQFGNTYNVDLEHKKVHIAKVKGWIKVRGLDQLKNIEFDYANAQLLRKASGYYLHIITWQYPPKTKPKKLNKNNMIGIDFGIGHNLTTTDGEVIDICIPETKALKLAQKRFNQWYQKRKDEGLTKYEIKSKSKYWKLLNKVRKAYEKLGNKKTDKCNKVVSNLLKTNELIVIQDELIHNWHKGLFGRNVQHSCMGLIKAELKKSSKVYVIESSFPSTQLCPKCGNKTPHSLDKREYTCSICGYHHDNRDLKAAETILQEGINRLFGTKSDVKQSPVKQKSSTRCKSKSAKSKKVAKSKRKTQEALHALA